MTVGAWALRLFGLFAFVSALDSFLAARRTAAGPLLRGPGAAVWMVLGSILGLYIASYTGVLLSVSNQPVWSDTWTLGGLFLVSGLSGSAALLLLLARGYPTVRPAAGKIEEADIYFVVLEVVLISVFMVTISAAGSVLRLFSPLWVVLWLLVLAGLVG